MSLGSRFEARDAAERNAFGMRMRICLTASIQAATFANIEKTFSQLACGSVGRGSGESMSSKKPKLKFSLSLVAVIALMAVVVGVVAGRTSGDSSSASGGGKGGAAAGKKGDVIIKASDSSFLQKKLPRARQARAPHRRQGGPLR